MYSSSAISLFSVAFLLSCLFTLTPAGDGNTFESVPDLEQAMYMTVDGYPCVRLLNLTGEIGCSNPGTGIVVAPIVRFKSNDGHLQHSSTILASEDELQTLLIRILNDKNFAKKVTGVLVESGTGYHSLPSRFSPDKKFPLDEFSPYNKPSYEWNPFGSSILWNQYDFPIFLLARNSTLAIQEIAERNEKIQNPYLANVVEFNSVMQTTKLGTHNSKSCLEARTCLPLGGYSVWSSLPPINFTSQKSPKPLLLAISSMDSASVFRDQSLGADSPMSGVISLLAAVDALAHVGLNELKKQLVFLVFTGEAWGYLGSRRFLAELDIGTDAVNGLNDNIIEQIVEIGSVGKSSTGVATFFAHAQGDSSSTKELYNAMKNATDSLQSKSIQIKRANISNPGIPPSSMMAFLKKNPSTSGIVLEEFDTAFANGYYHSHLDDAKNINSSSLVAAASLVARTLYILARDDLGPNPSVLNSIHVNETLVEELIGCLLTCEPGLSCDLVKQFISPSNTCPNHYVGVFLDSPSNAQHPKSVDDTSRFIWNFLADRTSIPSANRSSTCLGECINEGEVCIGKETQSKGRCVVSSTRYVPAYSTRLKFEDGIWHVIPASSSDLLGSVDPVWTESYWNTIGLRVYTVQSSTYNHLVLLIGIIITLVAYAAVVFTRAFFMKALKHD